MQYSKFPICCGVPVQNNRGSNVSVLLYAPDIIGYRSKSPWAISKWMSYWMTEWRKYPDVYRYWWRYRCTYTLCLKKRQWRCTLQLQRTSTDFNNFGRDVARRAYYRMVICYLIFFWLMSLCTTSGNMNPGNWYFQSCCMCLENYSLSCYNRHVSCMNQFW